MPALSFSLLQVPGYATQPHCTRPGGLDTTNGPVLVVDQCVAEQYYVRNSMLRSLIYSHVSIVLVVHGVHHQCNLAVSVMSAIVACHMWASPSTAFPAQVGLLPAGLNFRTGCGVCCQNHVLLPHCTRWPLDIHCLLPGTGWLRLCSGRTGCH